MPRKNNGVKNDIKPLKIEKVRKRGLPPPVESGGKPPFLTCSIPASLFYSKLQKLHGQNSTFQRDERGTRTTRNPAAVPLSAFRNRRGSLPHIVACRLRAASSARDNHPSRRRGSQASAPASPRLRATAPDR